LVGCCYNRNNNINYINVNAVDFMNREQELERFIETEIKEWYAKKESERYLGYALQRAIEHGKIEGIREERKRIQKDINKIPLRHIGLKCECHKPRECASVIAVEIIDYFKKLVSDEK
jgi:hypothetical protein